VDLLRKRDSRSATSEPLDCTGRPDQMDGSPDGRMNYGSQELPNNRDCSVALHMRTLCSYHRPVRGNSHSLPIESPPWVVGFLVFLREEALNRSPMDGQDQLHFLAGNRGI
jgi:hypothetical protein